MSARNIFASLRAASIRAPGEAKLQAGVGVVRSPSI
jgi:hypothetical protein